MFDDNKKIFKIITTFFFPKNLKYFSALNYSL
jgi:hypothetical protein